VDRNSFGEERPGDCAALDAGCAADEDCSGRHDELLGGIFKGGQDDKEVLLKGRIMPGLHRGL
jgi:hypothetical protein